jgi:ABC-type iron transport system FetAB permease component
MSNALKGTIPFGGQILPNSTVGAKLAAKNAQKKQKKNITSDAMKSIIP